MNKHSRSQIQGEEIEAEVVDILPTEVVAEEELTKNSLNVSSVTNLDIIKVSALIGK
ncbi:hypothetical protein A2U01_0094339, partial [Trifolium medium]|nr:hypothetical protein [Trifolium medium]